MENPGNPGGVHDALCGHRAPGGGEKQGEPGKEHLGTQGAYRLHCGGSPGGECPSSLRGKDRSGAWQTLLHSHGGCGCPESDGSGPGIRPWQRAGGCFALEGQKPDRRAQRWRNPGRQGLSCGGSLLSYPLRDVPLRQHPCHGGSQGIRNQGNSGNLRLSPGGTRG